VQRQTPIARISPWALNWETGEEYPSALDELRAIEGIQVLAVSGCWRTRGGWAGGFTAFLNAAAKLETTLGSHALLHRLLRSKTSRPRPAVKWEAPAD